MSLIQTDAAIVRGAEPLDPSARSPRRPSLGWVVAAMALAGAGLMLGVIAGTLIVFSTGLVAFC